MHEPRESFDRIDDRWLDRLDEIASGDAGSSLDGHSDDELLQIAGRLATTLAPLRELDSPAQVHRHHVRMHLRSKLAASHSWKKWLARPLIAAAALLLFVLLGPGLIFELNLAGRSGTHLSQLNSSAPRWTAVTLPSDYSFAILSIKDYPRGQMLLLPTTLAPNAYLLATLINSESSSATGDLYLIYTQNVHLYEVPSPPVEVNANANYSTIQIGSMSGILVHTGGGQNRIEWYQAGLLCDMVSKEPVPVMVTMIEQLQTVKL